MSPFELATNLATSYGFAGVVDTQKTFSGKSVYIAKFKENVYTGLPLFILCSEGRAEFAQPEENVRVFKTIM